MYVTTVINYKTTFIVNEQLVKVSLAIGEGEARNTILSWSFLEKGVNNDQ